MPIAAQMPALNRFRFNLFIILFNIFTFHLVSFYYLVGKKKEPGIFVPGSVCASFLKLMLEYCYLRKTGTPSPMRESRNPRGANDANNACCPHFDFYFLTRMPYYTTDK